MYIVFEGIVWSGKSTQAKNLVGYFESMGKEVVFVREPWSTPIAEDIRHLAQAKEWSHDCMHPMTSAYLYAAARVQMLSTIVRPALDAGKIVISDRSFLSSLAYQGEAQGLGFDTIMSINTEIIKEIFPERVFYMDIDIDIALSRTFDIIWDRWEVMGKAFFEAVILWYEKCEKLEILKNRFIRIDAEGSEKEVLNRILKTLE